MKTLNHLIYLLFSFVFMSSMICYSQETIGIKAGINHSNIKEIRVRTSIESRTSFHLGLFSSFKLKEKWSFSPEILYSNKGFTTSWGDLHLDYLSFPLLISFIPTKNLRLQIGPEIGYLLSSELKFKINGTTPDLYYFKNIDLSGAVGIEYQLLRKINVGFRYLHSILNIIESPFAEYDENGIPEFSIAELRNTVIQAYIGIRLKDN